MQVGSVDPPSCRVEIKAPDILDPDPNEVHNAHSEPCEHFVDDALLRIDGGQHSGVHRCCPPSTAPGINPKP